MQTHDLVTWTLAALSTFTVSFLLCKADTFVWLRTRLGCYDYGPVTYQNGEPMPQSALGRWCACPMCMSVFPVAPLVLLLVNLGWWQPLGWLAIAGVAILLFRWRVW